MVKQILSNMKNYTKKYKSCKTKYKSLHKRKNIKGGASALNQAKEHLTEARNSLIINSSKLLKIVAIGMLVAPTTLLKSALFIVTVPFEILNSSLILLQNKYTIQQSTLQGIRNSHDDSITQLDKSGSFQILHDKYVSFIKMCIKDDIKHIPLLCDQISNVIKGEYLSTTNILYSIKCKKTFLSRLISIFDFFKKKNRTYKNNIVCSKKTLNNKYEKTYSKEELFRQLIMIRYENMIELYNLYTTRLEQYKEKLNIFCTLVLNDITLSLDTNELYFERCKKFLTDVNLLKDSIVNCSPYNNKEHIKLTNEISDYIIQLYKIKEDAIQEKIKEIESTKEMNDAKKYIKEENIKHTNELSSFVNQNANIVSEKELSSFVNQPATIVSENELSSFVNQQATIVSE